MLLVPYYYIEVQTVILS